jgi:hypothetical protein
VTVPTWLQLLSLVWIAASLLSAACIAADLFRRPQPMAIMALVWPLTALYWGPIGLAAYAGFGRAPARASPGGGHGHRRKEPPLWPSLLKGASHCGAGCALGDLAGEWLVFGAGLTLAGSVLWADFLADFALAYLLGVVFQFFSIAPMRGLGLADGLAAAVKADSISIAAFEIGMFAFMGVSHGLLVPGLTPASLTYWFMMQIAMMVGFLTSLPANALLLRLGWKEAM